MREQQVQRLQSGSRFGIQKPWREAGGLCYAPFARGEMEALGDKALCPLVSGGLGIELESSGSWGRSLPGAPMVGLKGGHTQGSGFPLACSSPR